MDFSMHAESNGQQRVCQCLTTLDLLSGMKQSAIRQLGDRPLNRLRPTTVGRLSRCSTSPPINTISSSYLQISRLTEKGNRQSSPSETHRYPSHENKAIKSLMALMEGDLGRKAVMDYVRHKESSRAILPPAEGENKEEGTLTSTDPSDTEFAVDVAVNEEKVEEGASNVITTTEAPVPEMYSTSAAIETINKGFPEMTPKVLKAIAVEHEGYETPDLNDRLYLHFKGFRRVQCLEPYTGLKALWLDSNGLSVIEGLGHLASLRCLYLQNNLIEKIGSGLQGLTSLVTLDLSHNRLTYLEGLDSLSNLETLNLSRNQLGNPTVPTSVNHLKECPSLTNIDLSNNEIEDYECVVEGILGTMPKLVSLNLTGNPVCSGSTPQFRKRTINALPRLRYLDRPIFDVERVTSEAWAQGGREAEMRAREEFNKAKENEHKAQLQSYRDWVEGIRQRKAAEREAAAQATAAASGSDITQQQHVTSPPHEEEERQIREQEAKEAAAAEKALAADPQGVVKLGQRFWASTPLASTEDKGENTDPFGKPRPTSTTTTDVTSCTNITTREIFTTANVFDEKDAASFSSSSSSTPFPPPPPSLIEEEGEAAANNKEGRKGADSSKVLLEVD